MLELKEQIADIRAGRELAGGSPKIEMLSDRIDTSFVNLSRYAQVLETAVTKVVDSAERIQTRIRNWVLVTQLTLTVLLIWQAAAQWSLAGLGRKWYSEETGQ